MKLKLPHKLQAALMAALASVSFTTLSTGTLTAAAGAALLAGQQAQAFISTTTTYSDGTVYNGNIWTWNNFKDGENVSSNNSKYTLWGSDPAVVYTGSQSVPSGPSKFYNYFFNNSQSDNVGNTLRFDGYTGDIRLNTDWTNSVWVGGIITTAGNTGTYTFGRDNTTTFRLNGTGAVNMSIESNFKFCTTTDIFVEKGGDWVVAQGKTLEFSANNGLTLSGGIGVDISGGGLVKVSGALKAGGVGAKLSIAENTTLQVTGASTLGGTITNAGTVTFGGTVSLTNDLSGFDYEAEFTDYETGTTGKGFAGAKNYIIINNTGGGGCELTQVTYNNQTKNLVNGKMLIEGATDYSTYYIQADNASMDLAQAITYAQGQSGNLTTVNVQGANATITVGSAQSLNTLSIFDGKSATVNNSGAFTITTLTGAGALTKSGTGTLELTGISGYTGTIAVNAGELLITTGSLPNTLTVTGDGELHMRSAQGSGSMNVDLKSVTATNLHLDRDSSHNSRFHYNTDDANLTGVQHLYFDGGQLWLDGKDMTGNKAFTGAVTFNETTYSENNVFGGAAIRVGGNGTFSGPVTVNADTTLAWQGNKTIEFSRSVTGDGNLNLACYSGNGIFKISGDASEYTGAMTSVANVVLNVTADGQLNLGGGSNLAGAVTLDGSLTMGGDTNSTISGAISGAGSLTKTGAGTLTLSGSSSGAYTGAISVNQGTLAFQGQNTLGSDISIASTGTLALQADNCLTTTGTLSFASGSTLDLSHYSGTISTTPVTLASAGSISGFSGVNIVTSAPKGMEASVTLGGTGNNEIQVSYSVKQGATMHLYILTGQSNSLGAVKGTPLPGGMLAAYQSNGLLWNGNMNKDSGVRFVTNADWQIVAPQEPSGSGYGNPCMGPEYGFSYVMENMSWSSSLFGSDDTLAVVKASLDGGGNGYWLQDTNAYRSMLQSVKDSIQDAVDMGYTNISLDGLMYLQGESNTLAEANQAAERFSGLLGYLKTDLQSWLTGQGLSDVTLSFDSNAVTGEPATWTADNKQDPSAKETVTANQFIDLATEDGMINADGNGYGFVYTRDLAKITSGDNQNVHYRGTAQLTIGARYAYAFAVQKGVNVGAVRGQDDSATLDTGAAWWMETTPTENDIAVWDISSVSQSIPIPECNKIADGKTLTVGGIRIEDVYNPNATEPGYGSVGITGGTIQIGKAGLEGSGITLVGADLSISSAVNAVANQTWSAQNGHKLAVNGTTTISEGATLTFADDLYLTFGAITGTGNLAIGKVTFDMDMDYMLANGMGEYVSSEGTGDNGFFTGNLNLVKLTGDNSQITFTGSGGSIANITKAGELANYNLALADGDKSLQLTGLQPENTTYYARRGTVTYTDTDTEEYGIYTAAQVALAGSATDPAVLTLSSALRDGVTIKSEGLGGTINIASGIELAQGSVNASGAPVVLAGEGTFVLTPKSGDVSWPMPTNVNLATGENGWKGVVRISGGNFKANNLDALANGQYSTIELNGVSGWTNVSTGILALNLKLTDKQDGTAAWNFNAGNSSGDYDDPKMTITGKVSGTGTLKKTNGNHQSFAFAGNISEWTGAFDLTVDKKSRLTFQGDAHEVNIAVRKSNANGHISIAVGDGSNAFSTTFTDQSSIQGLDELLVRANAAAVINGGVGTNTTTLNGGSTLTIGGTDTTNTLGTMTVSGANAALVVNQAATATGTTVNANASLAVTNNAANSSLGNVLLKNGSALTVNGSVAATAGQLKVDDQCAAAITLGNDLNVTELVTIGAERELAVSSAAGTAKTLTAGALSFSNVSTVISLQNVNMVVSGAATAGAIEAHSNNKGTMNVGSGATLSLNGGVNWAEANNKHVTLNVTEGGTVNVGAGGTNHVFHVVNVNAGGTLDLVTSASTATVDGTAGNMTVGGTLKLAGEEMLTVGGTLTLQTDSTLDLARIFATQEAPVQANLLQSVQNSNGPLAIGGNTGDSGLLSGGLFGAAAPAPGATYILATANDISLASNVNLSNIAEGYTGTLSTQDGTDGKQLILTLAVEAKNLIWDNAKNDSKWSYNTSDTNWHLAGTEETGTAYFTEGSNVIFKSGVQGMQPQLQTGITAGTITVEENASVTIRTYGSNLTATALIGGGNVTQWGSGSTTVNGLVTLASLSVEDGTMVLNSTEGGTIGTLKITAGKSATLGNIAASTTNKAQGGGEKTISGNLTLNSGSVLTVLGNDSLNYGANNTITVNEGASINFSNARWTIGTNNKIVLAGGSITGTGENDANGALDFYQPATLTATDDSAISAPIRLRDGTVSFAVADAKTLTVNAATNGSGGLTKTGAGTLDISGAYSGTGAVAVSEGTLRLSNETSANNMLGKVSGAGDVELTVNATLSAGNTTSATGTLTVGSSATLSMGDGEAKNVNISTFGKVVLDNGTIKQQMAASTYNNVTVNTGKAGKIASIDMDSGTHTLAGDTTVDGTLTLANHWNAQFKIEKLVGNGTLEVKGLKSNTDIGTRTASDEQMQLTIDSLSSGDKKFTGSINIDHQSGKNKDQESFTIKSGNQAVSFSSLRTNVVPEATVTYTADAASTIASVELVNGGSTLTVNGDATTTITTLTGAGNLAKAGNGTLVIGGTNNYTGTVNLNSGTLDLTTAVTAGALTMSGGTLALDGQNWYTATTGNINLTGGTLDLRNLDLSSGAQSYTLATATSGNVSCMNVNFLLDEQYNPDQYMLVSDGSSLVLTLAMESKDLLWQGGDGTWVAGTEAQDWYLDDGSQTPASFGNGDNARFDSASADATVAVSGSVMAGSVTVGDGANVTLVTGNGNTLTAGNGITVEGTLALEGTGISGTLSGTGVVVGNDIPSAVNWNKSAVLGNLSLDAEGWTGTVEVGGGHHEFSAPYVVLDTINQLGTENSIVRLKGVGGYFDGGNISVGIELVNAADGSPAVLVTAGNNKTTTFSGSISGSGDLKFDKNGGSAETFKFTGDISQWNGSLTTGTQHTGPLTVELDGAANEVNASILQGGTRRALNLKVDNAATFNNTVKVSNVEIAGSEASATFLGDTQINTLAGAGKLVVDGANTTTTIGSGTNFSGAIDLLGGTLDLTTALTGVGSVNLDAGTLKLAGGDTAALASTGTITLGNNLTFDLSNYNSSLSPVEGGTTSVTLATATGRITGDAASVSLTGLSLEEGYKATLSVVDTTNTTNLVLTVKDESEQLFWLDPSGTWTARNSWYNNDKETRNTFQHGDSVTIVDGGYVGGTTINMVADASARNMTVTKEEGITERTTITIRDTVNENRLAAKTLVVDDDVTLVANTQLEVTKTVQIGTDAVLKLNSPKDATISAAISSEDATAVITKQGGNTLTLTGNNSEYTGSINVTAGTLAAQSANALGGASVTVSEGAKLSLENRDAMNAGSLTLNSGSTISFLGDSVLNLTGTLTLGDGVTWDLSRYGFDRPAQGETGTATLINVTEFSGDLGANPVITVPGIVHDAQLKYENGSVILTYTMDAQGNLYWKGGVGTWNTNADNTSWYPMREGGELTSFYNGDNVTFDDRAAISSVSLSEDITAGTVTVEIGTRVTLQDGTGNATLTAGMIDITGSLGTNVNVKAGTVSIADSGTWIVSGDKDRTFAGKLTGNGTLSKAGDGDLVLSGDNSAFTGEIQLNSGSITAADENALGTGTTIVMGDGTEIKGAESIKINTNGDTFSTLKGANSTVSADLNINAAGLTVAGDGTTVLSGEVGGSGNLLKDGSGTLVLGDNVTFTGNTAVKQGTLALESDYTTGGDFELMIGSKLQLAEQNAGTGETVYTYKDGKKLDPSTINFVVNGKLALRDGTYLDMSNIRLNSDGIAGVAKFDTLEAEQANPIGDGNDPYYYILEEGITIQNLEGVGGTTYARLVKDATNNLIYVQTFGGTNGAYWKGDADTGMGEWNRGGSQSTGTSSLWRTAQNGAQRADYNWGAKVPMSAYFFELTDSEGKTIDETTVKLVTSFPDASGKPAKGAGDVIIDGATKYTFVSTDDNYLVMNAQYPVAIIVRSGASAEFDFGIDASNGSWISVEKDATMVVDTRGMRKDYMETGPDYVQLYNVTNDGTMDMIAGRTWLKHVVNNQDMSIRTYEDLQPDFYTGSIQATVVYNAHGATLTMSGELIVTDVQSLLHDVDVQFTNDGTLVLNGSSITESTSGKMIDSLPVIGSGVLKTGEEEGAHAEIVFGNYNRALFATVEQSALDLGADTTTFEYGVDITDSTTVKAGKAANFYGGTGVGETAGSLGELTLKDEATITFGPRVEVDPWTGEPTGQVTAQSYDMGHVTAGGDSVLTVQKGATVTMDGYNAASGVPVGEIVVGAMPTGAPTDYAETASLTIGGPAAVDTITMHSGTMKVNGIANINQIMQDGGTLTLNANSVLNGVPVTEGSETLTGGTVTGGTLVLASGTTLDQNAVINVGNGGTYEVSGTGSRIDATDLELTVDRDSTMYREVVVTESGASISTKETKIYSGFMSSGDEYVKLFDVQYQVDENENLVPLAILTSNSEAVYHASASGMMTLIGTDNLEAIKKSIGSSTFDVEGHIGYGYLHTAALALKSYYVRDLYTEEVENPEDPTGDPLAADRVTLSDIIDATADTEHPQGQLENVVFDITDYNDDDRLLYNGTLTVDENVAVDLFSVSADATAAINIASGTTVTADADSPGVQGQLDLQGAGVYEIQDRNDLGTNIGLRDDEDGEWNGTVRVTGTSTDLTLEDKSVGEGTDASTIEFKNWNGALNSGEHTSDAKIVLTPPTAMTLTGEEDIGYTFTNTVSGSGNIDHAEGGNVAMTFTGDTAGWTGTYEQQTATEDSLTFTGGTAVNADVTSGNGSMDLTYGGSVETVAGDVDVYSGGDTPTTMNVAYTGEYVEVTGGITSDAQSVLSLTVGDGTTESEAVFSGAFTGTENATMAVKGGSAAVINTNATLQCVVGETGSSVTVADGATLSLASTDPETGYSEFHDLTNEGTIEMKASGGDIRLVNDTTGDKAFNLGNLVLTDPVGTATIETYSVADQETDVNITGLTGPKSAAQVLELMNGNATGTVNYNLGNTDDTKDLNGTIAYGGSGGVTNLVLQENGNSAASAVLETRFTSADARATANIVVDAEAARVLGLSSDGNTANKDMKVSGATAGNALEITGDGDYVYAGKLGEKLDIAYTGDGSQTIEGGVDNFRGKVTVDNGSNAAGVLEILNASSVSITDLTIGTNDTLDLNDGSNVGTAVVSGTMKAGGAGGTPSKLDGSLTLNDTAIYDVSASGGTGGLNLTGALTINEGAMLSAADMAIVWNMKVDEKYDLAFGVTAMSGFGEDIDWTEGVDASTVFGNGMKEGEYYIRYSGIGEGGKGGNVGAVYLFREAVPEPATSTLSLLALAALAARRRRK